jgi:hypothetical protein
MLDDVERLASAGFALHWLHPRSKRPIGTDWADRPVASVSKLRTTYREGNNLGVRLGKWSLVDGHYLHIIDMDVRNADLAGEAKSHLQGLFPTVKLNLLPTVQSGSGGASRHFYILTEKPFPSKKLAHSEGFSMVRDEAKDRDVKKWDWEIELLGTGKQAAIPPSIHPDTGKAYRWVRPFDIDDLALGVGPTPLDNACIERLLDREDARPEGERSQPLGLTHEEIAKVLGRLPFETYCEDREGWLQAGMAIHHETGGSPEGFALWHEFSKRSDKFDATDQKRVWKSFKSKPVPVRMASLVAAAREADLVAEFEDLGEDEADDLVKDHEFEDLGAIDEEDGIPERERKLRKENVEHELGKKAPKRVEAINKRYAVARVSSRTVIMDFHRDGSVTYGNVGDLHNFYENDRVATDKATEPVTKAWMRNKHRRTYPAGIVFAPGREVEGAYNHWQGFAVEPDPTKSCTLILKHIHEVLCQGDQRSADYLIGWLAHMIQKPEEKPGVAVVIRGQKGVGKDTLGVYVGGLFPHHHITISNQEQLLGKFNAHQEKCLLLHVEEGYWAGNKSAEGALKHLITSETVMIEPKGLNAFKVNSVLRLLMTSNEDWVVPATADERRYFVLDASSARRGDHAYFEALRDEMNQGGRQGLLHFLQTYDLSDFDVRHVPKTAALGQQKVFGLRNFDRWWYEVLQAGVIETGVGDWTEGVTRVHPGELRDVYSRWMRGRRYDGEELRDFEIGRRLKLLCPEADRRQARKDGHKTHLYVFPVLEVSRKAFDRYIGSKLTWDEPLEQDDVDEI